MTLTEAVQAGLQRVARAIIRQNVTDAEPLTAQRDSLQRLDTQYAIASRLSDQLRRC